MRFTQNVDGPAVQCTLADWLARGPGIPFLDRLTRVTLEENPGDVAPVDVPPAISRAIRAARTGTDPFGASVSEACLTWAREQPPEQLTVASRLALTPPPRRPAPVHLGVARASGTA